MAKTSTEIFNDKIGLIYEYNKKSPLFVRAAGNEIENNNLEHAIEILNQGLKQYPGYALGYLLLGKTFTLIGNYTQALKALRTGSDLINSPKTYDYYLKEIEIIKKQRSLFQTTRRTAFLTEEDYTDTNDPDLFEEEGDVKNILPEPEAPVDDRLEEIAREISSAKISETHLYNIPPIPALKNDNISGDSMIVSETLAKIYIAQGELKEAIQIYEKLKKKDPNKIDYFNLKIKQLKSGLEQ